MIARTRTRGVVATALSLTMMCSAASLNAAELERLSPLNWNDAAPDGKEADAIYGDYVLRNDRIVAVIAQPDPNRHANMTVRDVSGCLIDLTRANGQNDQLSAFYPATQGRPLRQVEAESIRVRNYQRSTAASLVCRSLPSPGLMDVEIRYTLDDGWDWVLVETNFINNTDKAVKLNLTDQVRADRTFESGADATARLAWIDDEWWMQSYGFMPDDESLTVSMGRSNRPFNIAFAPTGGGERTLAPGETYSFRRRVICAPHLLSLRTIAGRINRTDQHRVRINVVDNDGPVFGAKVAVNLPKGEGREKAEAYGSARTRRTGIVDFAAPSGKYELEVSAIGRTTRTIPIDVSKPDEWNVAMDLPGYVRVRITDRRNNPIPCKVQLIGRDGTPDPFFFPDTGEHGVHNVYYSHNGRFVQPVAPGTYDVIISYGPEYNAIFQTIEVDRGKQRRITEQLVRPVRSVGWVSAEYHSHSSPSGDNVSSQAGRVLNLLCENIEFAPCTEHNRLSTYEPHLRRFAAPHLMATCVGMELTASPGSVHHQNAFPLLLNLNAQDNGAPRTDPDVVAQIIRLKLWDGGTEKFVQQNHPNIIELLYDRDHDGQYDGAYSAGLPYLDAIEVHPLDAILKPADVEDKDGSVRNTGRNRMHAWLQTLNQGVRLPGVANTDAHYNFHGSGWLRNYVKSRFDNPAQIDTMDMVRASAAGHIVMSTAPFMEVSLRPADPGNSVVPAIPGDDIRIEGGDALLSVKVQCANWYDIDRVQVLLNGRAAPELNFTRDSHSKMFTKRVVRFEQSIPLKLATDTHVIVIAAGENSTLGPVMGEQRGKMMPIAVSNPIYVDVDRREGFQANRDTLDAPLPLPEGGN